jgi:hypothetical protein
MTHDEALEPRFIIRGGLRRALRKMKTLQLLSRRAALKAIEKDCVTELRLNLRIPSDSDQRSEGMAITIPG